MLHLPKYVFVYILNLYTECKMSPDIFDSWSKKWPIKYFEFGTDNSILYDYFSMSLVSCRYIFSPWGYPGLIIPSNRLITKFNAYTLCICTWQTCQSGWTGELTYNSPNCAMRLASCAHANLSFSCKPLKVWLYFPVVPTSVPFNLLHTFQSACDQNKVPLSEMLIDVP